MFAEGAPDSGYSWVIVSCCAYIHFALLGLFRSWGVIYVAVLQTYGVTREEASWPFSLCATVFQLMGPTVSILTHYVSQRAACLLGCTVATIGVIGCYFAENVMWITIFYGVVHGLGFGVVMTLLPVFLTQYFVKHRASAMGIAFSGGSISSLVIPIAMEWLLENYELKGSFLLLGGLVMNTLVAAALLRPPPWLKKRGKAPARLLEDSEAKDSGVSTGDDAKRRTPSVASLAVECEPRLDVENDDSAVADAPQLDTATSEEKQDTVVSNSDSMLFGGSATLYTGGSKKDDCGKASSEKGEAREPLMVGHRVCIIPGETQVKKKKRRFKISFHHSVIEILVNPMFHLICFTMFVFFVGLQSFFVVIVDYARDKGIAESDGVYLLTMFSVTDLLGRSGLGWITDRNFVRRKNMVIANLLAIGVINQLYPLIDDLVGLLAVAAFHGIAAGSCITLFFVLQAEYLGLKRLTLVVGLTGFINGLLTLLRPAIIGLFRDTIGSYDWMFHSLGLVAFVFAFIWLAESWVTKDRTCPNQSLSDKIGCK